MNGTITTPRLALVPLTTGNISFFLDDMPRFERETGLLYSGGELEFLNRPYLEKLKQELSDDPENQLLTTEYLISLRDGGRVIGCMDYKYLPRDGVTEVGYGLDPAYEGKGYMTEALRAFLDFGVSAGIRTVRADTLPDNIKSQNVLKRCGFRFLREEGNLWWENDLRLRFVSLREAPSLEKAAADWFSSKWGVPAEAYLECMDADLSGATELGWYLCLDGEKIVGGLGVIENDFHDRPDLSPNICAVYTEPAYRGLGIAGRLLDEAVYDLKSKGISPAYLLTDHTGFYERYGWEYLCPARGFGEENDSRMYIHK